jgi:hypothetical protein
MNWKSPFALALIILCPIAFMSCNIHDRSLEEIQVKTLQEDLNQKGEIYSASTQTLLRGKHWLESIKSVNIQLLNGAIDLDLKGGTPEHYMGLRNIPISFIIPGLNYKNLGAFDSFDAFNLRMQEYSRAGLSFPNGTEENRMTRFVTNLREETPWSMKGQEFIPNPSVRPMRVAVINNCLAPGLWELSAVDRSGEMFHGWFNFPLEQYYALVSKHNHIQVEQAKKSLNWSVDSVPIHLERMRNEIKEFPEMGFKVATDSKAGYSSDDSRRKIERKYVEIKNDTGWATPKKVGDILSHPTRFSSFIPPGKYSIKEKREFNFSYFQTPVSAIVREVKPLTEYTASLELKHRKSEDTRYLEIELTFPERTLWIGNLPLRLLVSQQDYAIHGFGVGIFESDGLAERRKLFLENGPLPSFAYVGKIDKDGVAIALNSHEQGLEQIFLRVLDDGAGLRWEIILSSYERISDIARFEVPVPEELQADVRAAIDSYITPPYFTYRDDNIN